MYDTFSSKIIWLTARFYWFAEASPTNEAIIKVYNIDKYGQVITPTLRMYTANSFTEVIELAFEIEKKQR